MPEYFADDREWVRFRCLEVAAERKKSAPMREILRDAESFCEFVMPKAQRLEINGGKDAKKTGKTN